MTIREDCVNERNQDVRSYAYLRNDAMIRHARKKRLRMARKRRDEESNAALRRMIRRQK